MPSPKALINAVSEVAKLASELKKPARMSKAEAEAAGLWHPISDIKMKKPVAAVQTKVIESPTAKMVEKKVISPEEMQGGVAFPLSGDRAAAGRILKELEGTSMNIPLEGGPEFMRANPGMAWASGKNVLETLAKRVREGAESGGDVYGVYTAMSPQAVDFNTMVTEALLKQLDLGALRKKDIKEFNRAVRAVKGQGGVPKAPDFPGVEHPELERLLMEGSGGQRDAFVKAMAKAQFQKLGFPDVAASRVAVTEPELLDIPRGMAGYTVAKMDPAARILEESGHKTYPFDLAGDYVGGLSQMIPSDIMFHDYIAAKKLLGSEPAGAQKSLEFVAPLQYLDQEWLDRVMKHLEETEKTRKEGLAEGGQPEKQDDGKGVMSYLRDMEMELANLAGLGKTIDYANRRPAELGLKNEHGGEADAMRHLLLARELGEKYPRMSGIMMKTHEYFPLGFLQSKEERNMDLMNNALGVELAKKAKSREEFERMAQEAIRSGRAKYFKGEPPGAYAVGGLIGEHNTTPDLQDGGRIIPVDNPILE